MYAKRVCKDIQATHLGEYHDLYLKSGKLLSDDVLKTFKKCV